MYTLFKYDSKEYNKNSISISSDYTYIIIIQFSLSVHDHVCGGLPDFGIHLASDFASFSHTQISLALFEYLYHALEDVWEVYHLVPFYFP